MRHYKIFEKKAKQSDRILNSLIVPKKVKGGPFELSQHSVVKYQKNWWGKYQKSRSPEKNWKGNPLVSSALHVTLKKEQLF